MSASSKPGWSDGSSAAPEATYTATGGTITAGGLYSAGSTPGAYQVIARHAGGTLADTSAVTITAATLTQLILNPSSTSLAIRATQQFTVSGSWSDGSSTPPAVTYTATGGTITTGGLYTAGSVAGTYRVIAVQTGGTRADTSVVTIVAPTLTRLTVSPKTASLATGGTQQFTWSASGGTISTSGLYTAGSVAGTYRVIASGGLKADTAVVTVTAPTTSTGNCATPQSGWIWCDDFEQDRLASYFEYDNNAGDFARVAGVGNNGSTGMRVRWQPGEVGAGSLKLAFGRAPSSYFRPVDAGSANYREIYWRMYVKNQPGWTGGGADKLSRAMVFAGSNWAEAMVGHVWSGGSASSYLLIDPASGTDAAGTLRTTGYNDLANFRWLGAGQSQTPLFDAAHVGRWYCVEAHTRLNSAGLSDGLFELWIDNALEAQRSGLNWVGSYNAYGINAIFFENYWNAGSPVTQERYFDDIVVSTQRIGCL